jgi:hypothetical protein
MLKKGKRGKGVSVGSAEHCYRSNLSLLHSSLSLKVPKREIFVTEILILSDPIWVGDLKNDPKKPFV